MFLLNLNWEGANIRPQICPRKIPESRNTNRSYTSPSDCLINVMTLWMSSEVVQYSPRIHNAAL